MNNNLVSYRQLKKNIPYISVVEYGIKGDGATDNTAALTSLIASGYTNLFFPNGTYLFNISIANGMVNITGESKTKTIFTPAVDEKAVIELNSATVNLTNSSFCNFSLLNKSTFTKTDGIKITGENENDRHTFRDIIIDNGFLHSIYIPGRTIWSLFENVWINGSLHSGIAMTGSTTKNLNTFSNVTVRSGKRYAVYTSAADGGTDANHTYKSNAFINCNFENNCQDTTISNQAAVYMYNLDNTTFLNCYIENNKNTTSTCYGIMSNGKYTRGLNIQGCLIWGQDYGVFINSLAMSGTIAGNRMANNTKDISLGDSTKAGTGNEDTNMFISGNTLKHQLVRNKDMNSNSFVSSTNPFSFPYRHANNSATPDVKNSNIVMCWTTEDVTNFTNGIDGQILIFRFYGSTSTKTIKNNTNIKTKDEKDITLSDGDTVTFIYYGNQWVEVIRSSSSSSSSNAYSSITFNGLKAFDAESPEDTIKLYSGDGIDFSASDGLYIENSGVLEVKTGSGNGTISVNTGGSSKDVAVKGLGSAAYTASTAYAASNHTHSNYALTTHTHSGYAASTHTHGLVESNLGIEVESTAINGGWTMLTDYNTINGFLLKSVRTAASAPNWLMSSYASGIAFGGGDTKGVMSLSYQSPAIKFAGGNGTAPVWYMQITGTNEKTYNLDNFATTTDIGNINALLDELNGTSV